MCDRDGVLGISFVGAGGQGEVDRRADVDPSRPYQADEPRCRFQRSRQGL